MSRRKAQKKYTTPEERIAYKNRVKRGNIENAVRKRERNRRALSTMRTAVKNAKVGISGNADDARDRMLTAISQLDKAAKKGVIKKQTAARRKSRLMKQFNRETSAA